MAEIVMATDLETSTSGPGLKQPAAAFSTETRTRPGGKLRRESAHEPAPSPKVYDETVDADHTAIAVGEKSSKNPWENGIDWPVVIFMAAVHLLAIGAAFFFTWKALAVFLFLGWFTGGIGVCLGYHRLLTHGSFQTYRPVRWFIAFVGGLSGQGSAITWIANHRKHHAFSDKEGDPHSPHDGPWWAHMFWFCPYFGQEWHRELSTKYAPDLVKDPFMRFLHKTFLIWQFAFGGLLFLIGYYGWDAYTGWSFVFWGIFFRMVFVWHVTWLVNSATHIWGYRNYETSDDSTNLWWVGLLSYGEGWHNNHHAFQRMARHGHKWWEIDMTYWTICAMEKLGLAWNVVHSVPSYQKPQ
jgi:fatty-acid desaturase